MVRISGVDLPRNKRIEIGLTYIFGIGLTSSKQILELTGISPATRCVNLTDDEINALRTLIDEKYQTEGDLRRVYSLNIKFKYSFKILSIFKTTWTNLSYL
jgi:small subunit ribosomal protein S13